jgi:hypothetical protein
VTRKKRKKMVKSMINFRTVACPSNASAAIYSFEAEVACRGRGRPEGDGGSDSRRTAQRRPPSARENQRWLKASPKAGWFEGGNAGTVVTGQSRPGVLCGVGVIDFAPRPTPFPRAIGQRWTQME